MKKISKIGICALSMLMLGGCGASKKDIEAGLQEMNDRVCTKMDKCSYYYSQADGNTYAEFMLPTLNGIAVIASSQSAYNSWEEEMVEIAKDMREFLDKNGKRDSELIFDVRYTTNKGSSLILRVRDTKVDSLSYRY